MTVVHPPGNSTSDGKEGGWGKRPEDLGSVISPGNHRRREGFSTSLPHIFLSIWLIRKRRENRWSELPKVTALPWQSQGVWLWGQLLGTLGWLCRAHTQTCLALGPSTVVYSLSWGLRPEVHWRLSLQKDPGATLSREQDTALPPLLINFYVPLLSQIWTPAASNDLSHSVDVTATFHSLSPSRLLRAFQIHTVLPGVTNSPWVPSTDNTRRAHGERFGSRLIWWYFPYLDDV